jgi:ABC-type antimicrobial peptide transport system permease subunit
LWGRKLRTFLTTLAIVFGAWLIFAMNILMPTMLKAFEANMLAALIPARQAAGMEIVRALQYE